jgi:hypothetical protein
MSMEAEESAVLRAVTTQRLVKTQTKSEDLVWPVVNYKICEFAVAL